MTFVPLKFQLQGRSFEKASLYGMPHLDAYYAGEGAKTHKRIDRARCCICGRLATNAHHVVPLSAGSHFVLQTPFGAFALKSPLFAVCGSGTCGCHNDFHGGARYKVRWVWESELYAEQWWDGSYLSRGLEPHGAWLWELGHYEIEDKLTGRSLHRSGLSIGGVN